jgi:nitrite reductase (NO-forming)
MAVSVAVLATGVFVFTYVTFGLPNGLEFPAFQRSFGPGFGPSLPLKNVFKFFQTMDDFERVPDIAENPDVTGSSNNRAEDGVVEVFLEAKEVLSEMGPNTTFNYWTFNGQVPGPFIRVKQNDMVKLTLTNNISSLHPHNIDLHAVTGPGGGAVVTLVEPGQTKSLTFKALNPGIYVYHCATPNVPSHMTHGMYGLILVEPEGGLPPVDKEFYVMQGEFYSTGKLGQKGLQVFDSERMLDGNPTYVVFNGKTGGITGKMHANVGDRVRIYFGNGGVNLVSSFHVIGEIFDDVYPEGAIGSDIHHNVQSTSVPAGGATMVDFTVEYPGKYILVDHALARLDKGAWGVLEVVGDKNPEIFNGDFGGGSSGH